MADTPSVRKQGSVNWPELAATSHYQTAVAVEQQLRAGNIQDAAAGLQELIDALGRSEKRALKSQLIRLMAHIIKWHTQPEKRSHSWVATIYNAREEIADIQAETSGLTDSVIGEMWEMCFRAAKREAEGDMNQPSPVPTVSWEQVFEEKCEIE
jgi:hypothetical protein